MKIHHIGIVVDSIQYSLNIYKQLGYVTISTIIQDFVQSNKLIFIASEDHSQVIELIEPMNENSTVYSLKNRGYHHICYVAENIDEEIDNFKSKRIGTIFTKKIKAPAFNNKNIIFAYLKNGTIIEFLEKGDADDFI